MEKILSRQNDKIKHLTSLYEEKNRKNEGLFVSEGILNLKMALEVSIVKEIYTLKELDLDIPDDVKIYQVDEKVMDKISREKNPSGLVFVAAMPKYNNRNIKKAIYLDKIQDPGNMGTIIRTALALGIDMIYVSKDSVSVYNPKVLSAARGANYKLPIIEKDFDELLLEKNEKTKIIVTTLDEESISLEKCPKFDSYILVFGNEGSGVRKEIISHADYKIKIAMKDIDSLNVAISAGIIIYHFNH
jgi:TrmH family RNA methyltransferase